MTAVFTTNLLERTLLSWFFGRSVAHSYAGPNLRLEIQFNRHLMRHSSDTIAPILCIFSSIHRIVLPNICFLSKAFIIWFRVFAFVSFRFEAYRWPTPSNSISIYDQILRSKKNIEILSRSSLLSVLASAFSKNTYMDMYIIHVHTCLPWKKD